MLASVLFLVSHMSIYVCLTFLANQERGKSGGQVAVFVLSRGKISTLGDTVGYSGQTELTTFEKCCMRC